MDAIRVDRSGIRDRQSGRWVRAWRAVTQHGLQGVWRMAREAGIGGTAAFVARNLRYLVAIAVNRRFDRKYRVDTAGDIPSDFLEVVGDNREYGAAFLSTPERTFRAALACVPNDLSGFTFVDFGAGKGRVMLMASSHKFRRILGVEYAPELVACAERNFATYRNPAQLCRDLWCECADAAEFELPEDEPAVLYFLRPFEDVVMARVLDNIVRSYAARPRQLYLMFVTPDEPAYRPPSRLIRSTGIFRLAANPLLPFDWGGVKRFELMLYETMPD